MYEYKPLTNLIKLSGQALQANDCVESAMNVARTLHICNVPLEALQHESIDNSCH